jgi:hypothetical protein
MQNRNMPLTSPFNPRLLQALDSAFGDVRIIHRGEERQLPRKLSDNSRTKMQWGEQYAFRCPFCHDTEQPMVVSYQFGVQEFVRRKGSRPHVIHCFGLGCHTSELKRVFFLKILTEHGYEGLDSLQPSRSTIWTQDR